MESALISSSSWVSRIVKVADSHVVKVDGGCGARCISSLLDAPIKGQETLGSATGSPLLSSTSNREIKFTGV